MTSNGSGQKKPLVSVIIPTYNRSEILRECLSALALQNFPFGSFEIIIVDDGSSENTAEIVWQVRSPFEIRYFRQNNSGPAAARNLGVRNAAGELILIMNDDAIATGNLVAGHYYMHQKMNSKRLAVLGTREFRNEDKVRTLNFLYDQVPFSMRVHSLNGGFYPSPYFVTFNISLKKKDFEAIGGFDEDFTTAIGEDTEFGIRWTESGGRIFFMPQLRANHIHDVSVESLKSQIIREHYNTLIMIHKQRPFCKPLDVFRQSEYEMMEYMEKVSVAMKRFEADLTQCQKLSIWDIEGREWLGEWTNSITDFVVRVRLVYLKYCAYVTVHRYLTDPEARAFVQKWSGPNNTETFHAPAWGQVGASPLTGPMAETDSARQIDLTR